MEVIPVINCEDRACAEKKLAILGSFLEPDHFVHVDIADGVFTPHKTWNDPVGWRELGSRVRLEAHLMVEDPAAWMSPWLVAGVARFVIHVETIDEASFAEIKRLCDQHGVAVMLTSNPEIPAERFSPYIAQCSAFQVLSVHPGLAGQPFLPLTLEKVRWLRENVPHAIIEVDGGINQETARLAKAAGADIIVSATDIFESADPKREYEALKAI